MRRSFRFWIVVSYTIILAICYLSVFILYRAFDRVNDFDVFHAELKRLKLSLFETNKLKEDILTVNIGETIFFTGNTSLTERNFWIQDAKFRHHLNWLQASAITTDFDLKQKVRVLKQKHTEFKGAFRELIRLYKLKGFKSYGLEGLMRTHAHAIYDYDNDRIKLTCLMLRRHEKDFLLRKDPVYIREFNLVCNKFAQAIVSATDILPETKSYLLKHLADYSKYFNMLARIEGRLGLKGSNGVLFKSGRLFNDMLTQMDELDKQMGEIKQSQRENAIRNTTVVLVLLFLVLTAAIVLLTRTLTTSIKGISGTFNHYIHSGFMYEAVRYHRSNIREFNSINLAFVKMAGEIDIYTNFFKEKVLERTLEINRQKEEIQQQQQRIEAQYVSLLGKNKLLSKQKELLAEKNTGIRDSLRYAKRIQRAILPKRSDFSAVFSDSFLLYKPKDVVSGDFYFIHTLVNPKDAADTRVLMIAADCTGHGVPGALMSVIGINTINKLVKEQQVCDPGQITRLLDENLNSILTRGTDSENQIADGMDIAVFCYHKKYQRLEFCVSRMPAYLLSDGKPVEIQTGRLGLGLMFKDKESHHTHTQAVQVKTGDCLYLFSDGFGDQFGGAMNKKFKKSNLINLINAHHGLTMIKQKTIYSNTFKSWKGGNKQTDDVMLIGLKF